MLKGKRVTLRGIRRDDLPRLWEFNNDIEVEIAGGAGVHVSCSRAGVVLLSDNRTYKGKCSTMAPIEKNARTTRKKVPSASGLTAWTCR